MQLDAADACLTTTTQSKSVPFQGGLPQPQPEKPEKASNMKFVTTSTRSDAASQAAGADMFVSSVTAPCPTGGAHRAVSLVVRSPLQLEFFMMYLHHYPERELVLEGITTGVDIGYRGIQEAREHPNWPSVRKYARQTYKVICEDVNRGRTSGPFPEPPHPLFVASPLGAFERKRSGKIRVIHDLSWPAGRSVNDGIDAADYGLQYITVDEAVILCIDIGHGEAVFMAKLDLKDAFKHILVRLADRHLLGFIWDPQFIGESGDKQYFYSNVLEFGLRSSPALFDRYAAALQYIMQERGATGVIRYMDDYLTVSRSFETCQNSLSIMLDTCRRAGFEVQPEKVTEPDKVVEFLGIIIDSESKELRISEERLSEIYGLVLEWRNKTVCTKRQLLSLIGKLIFVSRVVRSGRSFVGRLINLSKKVRHLHHKIKLNQEARGDIAWWIASLHSHNGIAAFPAAWDMHQTLHVYSDASDQALAAVWQGRWFKLTFTGRWQHVSDESINYREMLAVLKALATWGPEMHGNRVTLHIDNQVTCHCLNKGASRSSDLMSLIRAYALIVSEYELECRAVYIESDQNVMADALSRLDMKRFRQACPEADKCMTWPAPVWCDGVEM